MVSALAAVVLAASPAAVQQDARPSDVPHVVTYTYPLAMVGLGAISASVGGFDALWLPLGAELPLSETLSIDLELGFARTWNQIGGDGWALTVAAGPTWYPFASRPLSGFFIGPRFQFLVGDAPTPAVISSSSGPLDAGPEIRRAFLVGFDVGWQLRVGRVVFGPVLGAAVGYQFDRASVLATPFDMAFTDARRPDSFCFALNVNLFRLGVAL